MTIALSETSTRFSGTRWLSWLALGILVFMILVTTAESLQSQIIRLGIVIWPNYTQLRDDNVLPNCDPDFDIEQRLDTLAVEMATQDADSLLEEEFDREQARRSLIGQQLLCQELMLRNAQRDSQLTPAVKIYRELDAGVAAVAGLALRTPRTLLALLIFITAAVTSLRRHHIAFRPVESLLDHRVSSGAQFLVTAAMTVSVWRYREQSLASGIPLQNPELLIIMLAGFGALTLIHGRQLLQPPVDARSGGTLLHALLSIPLYTYMLLAGSYFFIFDARYIAGLSLHFATLFELAGMFLQISLYLWVGMLLKQTRLGERVFAIFSPLKLPPELLCVVAMLVMAVPTAYTGGSGIIVLAMGAVVYEELRRVGTRRSFALATTALTGSAGIVLSPCILIMMIAIMNNQVVSSELYQEGVRVFLLTLLVFTLYAVLTKQSRFQVTPLPQAIGPMLHNARPLLAYAAVIAAVVLAYALLLDAWVDEFSAAIILPVVIMVLVYFERRWPRISGFTPSDTKAAATGTALGDSIDNAIVHIGALLLFIGANMVLGGVVQRSGAEFDLFSGGFVSPLVGMGFLLVALVMLGMFMESMSGVVFVTATLASVAYQAGIHPVHFWMTTLVALELGFLTPPVALNHLYVRQVVGEAEFARAAAPGERFWYRHERILLPIAVMGTTLLIVAFGPFITGYQGWYP